jgi:exopolysaccharide biosynthesis polyprenyl glycosylphosphotransferase
MNQRELWIKSPYQQPPRISNAHWSTVRNATQQHGSEVDTLTYEPSISVSATPGNEPLMEVAQSQDAYYPALDDILPEHHFLQQLRREKARTDRSKAPLSIALFRFESEKVNVTRLFHLLRHTKRETDILGYLCEDKIAILLTDTNEQGAQRLTQKITAQAQGLLFSTELHTYPDQIFESLVAQNQRVPDSSPFLVNHQGEDAEGPRHRLKRALDIVGALGGLLLLSPVMLVIALAVAMTSPGPIIFRQIRLGKGGVPFAFYKFRSMRCDADDRIHRDYVTSLIKGDLTQINQGDTEKPMYKLKADPRVTRVGRIIRKTSLDELPQFFNVLKGDMSLVGPRPPLSYEVAQYQSWHLRRILDVKPGITGLWQVEGRSKTSFDDMVRLDIRYMRSSSLMLDLRLLFKTVKVVLKCDGAK